MADTTAQTKFRALHGLVKTASIAWGLAATLISLSSLAGAVVETGWIRLPVALLIALVVPLVLVDRLLPARDPARARGLATDVLAFVWLGFAFAYTVGASRSSKPLLAREGDRLVAVGFPVPARFAYLLAGVDVRLREPVSAAPASASPALSSALTGQGADASGEPEDAPGGETASTVADASQAAPADAARPEGDRREKSPAELFKDLAPAVVAVTTKGPLGRDGGGTGFLIDREGTIATNHHVIADSTAVRIKFMNGARFADVELLAEDAVTDLALLRVSLSKPADGASCADVVPVVLGDSGSVVVGERAVSIGNPLGLEHTLTDGLVSARRVFEGKQWIQISVPVSPGNSGGPLFNMRAEAIGVTTAQVAGGLFGRAQNLNLAVPVNVLKSMLRPSYPQRRKIGDAPSAGQW